MPTFTDPVILNSSTGASTIRSNDSTQLLYLMSGQYSNQSGSLLILNGNDNTSSGTAGGMRLQGGTAVGAKLQIEGFTGGATIDDKAIVRADDVGTPLRTLGVPVAQYQNGTIPTNAPDAAPSIGAAMNGVGRAFIASAGVYKIASNLTIPVGKVLFVHPDARFEIVGSAVMTVLGSIVAERSQTIFTGTRKVVGILDVDVTWFGAVGNWADDNNGNGISDNDENENESTTDNTVDDTAAIQAAIDCVMSHGDVDPIYYPFNSDGWRQRVTFQARQYRVDGQLNIICSSNDSVRMEGAGSMLGSAGTKLVSSVNGAASAALLNVRTDLPLNNTADSSKRLSQFQISGIALFRTQIVTRNANGDITSVTPKGLTTALRIGTAGPAGANSQQLKQFDGFYLSEIEDFRIEGFTVAVDWVNARLVAFRRGFITNAALSTATNLRVRIDAGTASRDSGQPSYNSTAGYFEHVVFALPQYQGEHLDFRNDDVAAGSDWIAEMAQWKFFNCTYYGGNLAVRMEANGGVNLTRRISDFHFLSCDFDGRQNQIVRMIANNGAIIDNIAFSNCYMNETAGDSAVFGQQLFQSGQVNRIVVTNGGSGYTSNPTVTIGGNGTGATATAVRDGQGRVQYIDVAQGGSGYSNATVTISGGGGQGATAVAVLLGQLQNISLTDCYYRFHAGRTFWFEGGTNLTMTGFAESCGNREKPAGVDEHVLLNQTRNATVSISGNQTSLPDWSGMATGVVVNGGFSSGARVVDTRLGRTTPAVLQGGASSTTNVLRDNGLSAALA